jgi:hypothetical protein
VVVVGESLTRRGFDIWQIKLPVRGPCKRCPGFESRAKNYPPSNMKDMSIGFVSLFLGLLSYSLLKVVLGLNIPIILAKQNVSYTTC